MAIPILLKNKDTNQEKVSLLGVSWTIFFFGAWVLFFRKDWKMLFFIIFAATLLSILALLPSAEPVDATILELICGMILLIHLGFSVIGIFVYNRFYTQNLINQGYRPVSSESSLLLKCNGIIIPE